MLFAGLGSVLMMKNCDLGRENAASGSIFKPSVSFSPYGPPSRQITYLYLRFKLCVHQQEGIIQV